MFDILSLTGIIPKAFNVQRNVPRFSRSLLSPFRRKTLFFYRPFNSRVDRDKLEASFIKMDARPRILSPGRKRVAPQADRHCRRGDFREIS